MTSLRGAAVIFVLATILLAHHRASAEDANPPEVIDSSPSGSLKVMGQSDPNGNGGNGSLSVWVESGEKRADLPPSPVDATDAGNSWTQDILPEIAISPDARWLFATQKIVHGYGIGYLYRQVSGLKYAIATKTRFDILAWQFFGKNEGLVIKAGDLPNSTHIIDFLAFGHRYLAVSLRGAIDQIPATKKVPHRTEGDEPTGVFPWQCLYDLQSGTFLLTDVLAAYNQGAWSRWVDTDTGEADADHELNAAYQGLKAILDATGQQALRGDERTWLKDRDQKVKAGTGDVYDLDAQRAAALEIRRLEATH